MSVNNFYDPDHNTGVIDIDGWGFGDMESLDFGCHPEYRRGSGVQYADYKRYVGFGDGDVGDGNGNGNGNDGDFQSSDR